ncbi:MAG: anti-sigma factor [Planctomycetota bacterium]
MTTTASPNHERLMALLADRALDVMTPEEDRELERLLDASPSVDPDCMDRVVAALSLQGLAQPESMPASLESKLLAEATRWEKSQIAPVAGSISPAPRMGSGALLGWLAAAACLFIAAIAWFAEPVGPSAATPADGLALLIDEADDLVEIDWAAAKPDPLVADAVTGRVVWSPSRQEGYMVFSGLGANDPTQDQYQLWIFDAERNEAHPVDGGVFDVASAEGETVIRIDPRVPVSEATLFAITVEPPGGVVVSTRERLPLIAAVPEQG